MGLSEVIAKADDDYWYADQKPCAWDAFVAAAVVAWMQSDEAVERMARAADPHVWSNDRAPFAGPARDMFETKRRLSLARSRSAIAALSEPPR